jgi:hypothetical protein
MGGRGKKSLSEGGGGTTLRYSLGEGGGGTTRRYSTENTYMNSTEDRRRLETMYVSSPDVTNNKPQNTIGDWINFSCCGFGEEKYNEYVLYPCLGLLFARLERDRERQAVGS